MARLILKLTGTRPMLMHSGRLANPLDPHTRRVGAAAAKKKKTVDEIGRLAILEARGGMYETDKGFLGLPDANVWRAIHDASKKSKLGQDVKRALQYEGLVAPLLVGDRQHKCDGYITNANIDERLLYVGVVVGRGRVMRSRAIIPKGWQAEVAFEWDDDLLPLDTLEPIIERAGSVIGLMDWRPRYGLFTAKIKAA